jgi:hypothetical protein
VEQDSEPVVLEPLEAVAQRFIRLRVQSLIEFIDGFDYEIGCYLGEAATRCQNDPVMYVHRSCHQCGTPKGDPRSLDRQLTVLGSVLGRLPAHPARSAVEPRSEGCRTALAEITFAAFARAAQLRGLAGVLRWARSGCGALGSKASVIVVQRAPRPRLSAAAG